MRPPDWLVNAVVVGGIVLFGLWMGTMGLGRATENDVRAVQTQIAQRCGN